MKDESRRILFQGSDTLRENEGTIGRGLSLLLLFLFCLYLPATNNYFTSDDFNLLSFAAEHGLSAKSFFLPASKGVHFFPVFRFLLAAEYAAFNGNPRGYYLVNITLHLLNVCAVFLLCRTVFRDARMGLLGSLLFGISASHWRLVMWVTMQAQLIATLWFILAAFFFVEYTRSRGPSILLLSLLCHLLTLLSFTSGFEIPLLFGLFVLLSGEQTGTHRRKLGSALRMVWPFAAIVVLTVCLRWLFREPGSAGALGGVSSLLVRLPKCVAGVLLGMHYNFICAFTGAYAFNLWGIPIRYIDLIMGGIALLLLAFFIDPDRLRKDPRGRLIACFFAWSFCIYLLPAFARISSGLRAFAIRGRYAYAASFPAVIVAIAFLRSLQLRGPVSGTRVVRSLAIAGLLFVVYANAHRILERQNFVDRDSHGFEALAKTYLEDLEILGSSHKSITVLDEAFTPMYSGWNVLPSRILKVHNRARVSDQVEFIRATTLREDERYSTVYEVESETGHLKVVPRAEALRMLGE